MFLLHDISVSVCLARRQTAETMIRLGEAQRPKEVKVETGETGERNISPAASGLYFPRHSDFILTANKERVLCLHGYPRSSHDGEDEGAGKENILAYLLGLIHLISLLDSQKQNALPVL